ncbi:MAG: N-acylglucosamine 2-epimerase, partial [Streptosporangiaceae bacterium]
LSGGRLIRTSRDDKAGDTAGTLEDYACVAEGFLTLYGVTGEARWLRLAAGLLAAVHLAGGRLVRTSRDGTAGGTAGALDDHACVAEGFLTLSGVTGEARWMQLAGRLLEVALGSFGDGQGGFFDTAVNDEALIFRPADPADNATPSGTFAVAGALLGFSALARSARHREAAGAALGVLPGIAARYPRAAGAGLAVAEAWLAGPPEIAVVGSPRDDRTRALHETALHAAPPGAVLALGDGTGSTAAGSEGGVPLLAGRGLVDGAPAAYVCRQFACQAPVTTPEQLRQALAGPS